MGFKVTLEDCLFNLEDIIFNLDILKSVSWAIIFSTGLWTHPKSLETLLLVLNEWFALWPDLQACARQGYTSDNKDVNENTLAKISFQKLYWSVNLNNKTQTQSQ